MGIGVVSGFEYPIAKHWTILTDAMFSVDYPNFGSNSLVQPFDYSWQYHASLGVRYSKKGRNEYSYIDSRVKKNSAVQETQEPADDKNSDAVSE